MKLIQYILVCLSIVFLFTVLHNNLIENAQSSISSSPPLPVHNSIEVSQVKTVAIQNAEQTVPIFDKIEKLGLTAQDSGNTNSNTTITGAIDHGDTFDTALKRDNVPQEIRSLIINNLADTLDFKRLRPSDSYTLNLDESGNLDSFRYHSGPIDSVSITNSFDGYIVQKDPIDLERRRIRISGIINSSLFGSFANKDEDVRLVYAFADIFASKIDFNTEVRKGDRYSIVVDKYFKNGELVGYGKILSARYELTNNSVFQAFYYKPSDENIGSYFDQSGQAVGTSFLRSPLPFGRVSSRFTYSRKHPVTGVVKPHLGIDLAAPRGTPIMAAADGTVSFIGRNSGNGNQIVLTHMGGFKTYYGHLSKFKKGLRRGDTVIKKSIIGYVGSTGISTGPHLDYRIKQNNTFKNPFSIEFKPKVILSDSQLQNFFAVKNHFTQLENTSNLDSDKEILQVSHLTLSSSRQLTLL